MIKVSKTCHFFNADVLDEYRAAAETINTEIIFLVLCTKEKRKK